MKILHIGLSANGEPLNGLQKALMKLGEYEEISTSTFAINDIINHKAVTFKPDLTWIQVQRRDVVSIEAVENLKRNGSFVMNWSGDKRLPIPSFYYDFGRHVNLTLFSNKEDVFEMNRNDIKSDFLEIGYDPEIYYKKDERFVYDVIFLGNNNGKFPLSPLRVEMVNFLRSEYGTRFGLYGNGWGELANGSFMGNQQGEADIIRKSKLVINLSHFDCYTSDRLYRSLGCGRAVLSHRFNGIDNLIDKCSIAVWNDLNDLKHKIDHYLKNNEEREFVASNGSNYALENCTFDKMAENINNLYNKHK